MPIYVANCHWKNPGSDVGSQIVYFEGSVLFALLAKLLEQMVLVLVLLSVKRTVWNHQHISPKDARHLYSQDMVRFKVGSAGFEKVSV